MIRRAGGSELVVGNIFQNLELVEMAKTLFLGEEEE